MRTDGRTDSEPADEQTSAAKLSVTVTETLRVVEQQFTSCPSDTVTAAVVNAGMLIESQLITVFAVFSPFNDQKWDLYRGQRYQKAI